MGLLRKRNFKRIFKAFKFPNYCDVNTNWEED